MVRGGLSGRKTSKLRLEQCDKAPTRMYGDKTFQEEGAAASVKAVWCVREGKATWVCPAKGVRNEGSGGR